MSKFPLILGDVNKGYISLPNNLKRNIIVAMFAVSIGVYLGLHVWNVLIYEIRYLNILALFFIIYNVIYSFYLVQNDFFHLRCNTTQKIIYFVLLLLLNSIILPIGSYVFGIYGTMIGMTISLLFSIYYQNKSLVK